MATTLKPAFAVLLVCSAVLAQASGPLPPAEALKSFEFADDALAVELVAAEPDVLDPVSMAFDEKGRLYVTEMRGFQLGPEGKGVPGLGRVRQLLDTNGDGKMDRSSVFADGMFHPTSVQPAYGGVIVAAAPDLLYFQDRDGDGVAEVRVVLFTGFGQSNHEQLLNSLQWGLDNWIHASSGGNGGDIRAGDQPEARPVSVHGRDFRFRLRTTRLRTLATQPAGDLKGSDFELETTTGGGQFGLTANSADDWFTCSNARHIIEIMLPDRYLKRNPYLAVPGLLADIADHGAAARIHRISPLEEWRVVRTQQRATGPEASRFAASELAPGGFFTAACGITIYEGAALGPATQGDAYVCDAANNLVHRDRLVEDGIGYIARRVDRDREFLASKDSWCRPVSLATGPDGCLYIVDMYRQVIETPVSIPASILKTINLENGKENGRIYRIRSKSPASQPTVGIGDGASNGLVNLLGNSNRWWRLTAQRLLVERQDASVVEPLRRLITGVGPYPGRVHALWALEGLNALDDATLIMALRSEQPELRVQALRLAENRLPTRLLTTQPAGSQPATTQPAATQTAATRAASSPVLSVLAQAVLSLQADSSLRVRLQLAFTLGYVDDPAALQAMVELARREIANQWMRTALLSSLDSNAVDFWRVLSGGQGGIQVQRAQAAADFIEELLAIIGARRDEAAMVAALETLGGDHHATDAWWRAAALSGLADGFERSGGARPTTQPGAARERMSALALALISDPNSDVRQAARHLASRLPWSPTPELARRMEEDLRIAADPKQAIPERVSAIKFVASGDPGVVEPRLEALLQPEQPPDIQKAVVAALVRAGRSETIARLVTRTRWQGYTPAVRDELLNAIFARNPFVPILLTAIEKGDVPAWAVDAARAQQLLQHRDQRIRARATQLFKLSTPVDRQKAYDNYLQATQRTGDPAKGRAVFRTNCSACHLLEGVGNAVGPDLASVRDRDPVALLRDVLDPSAAIVAGYSYYVIDTRDGETIMGVISSESANTVTVRQREDVERTLLRTNIASIYASGLSMMPGDFERTISLQEMADLIAYLKAPKGDAPPSK